MSPMSDNILRDIEERVEEIAQRLDQLMGAIPPDLITRLDRIEALLRQQRRR